VYALIAICVGPILDNLTSCAFTLVKFYKVTDEDPLTIICSARSLAGKLQEMMDKKTVSGHPQNAGSVSGSAA
jgi:hypothetical protein